jgi:hypothetical protein
MLRQETGWRKRVLKFLYIKFLPVNDGRKKSVWVIISVPKSVRQNSALQFPVIKRPFVLPDRSNPAQHNDIRKDSDKQDKKTSIFAPGNENSDAGIIPPEALGEVFGEDVNPEDLDIDETDGDGDEMPEEEELLRTTNGNLAYADGCTIDEMTEAVETADKPESEQSPEGVETL